MYILTCILCFASICPFRCLCACVWNNWRCHAKGEARCHARGEARCHARGEARCHAKGEARCHARGEARCHARPDVRPGVRPDVISLARKSHSTGRRQAGGRLEAQRARAKRRTEARNGSDFVQKTHCEFFTGICDLFTDICDLFTDICDLFTDICDLFTDKSHFLRPAKVAQAHPLTLLAAAAAEGDIMCA